MKFVSVFMLGVVSFLGDSQEMQHFFTDGKSKFYYTMVMEAEDRIIEYINSNEGGVKIVCLFGGC